MSLLKLKNGVILSFMLIFLLACTDNDTEIEYTVYPDNEYFFELVPNDMAANDSISANLTHGLKIIVHPNAVYELSFKKDVSESHVPELQLFRLFLNQEKTAYYGKKIRSLKPKEIGNRYVYTFECNENDKAEWATSLVVKDKFYKGSTDSVKFVGDGFYSDNLSLNFIVVGKHSKTLDNLDINELAQKTLQSFRKYYTSINIDTIFIRYAHEHPTLGEKYKQNEPWLAGKSSDDLFLYELGGWPEANVRNALDIVYVYRIETDMTIGFARLFSANLGGGEASTLIVGNYVMSELNPRDEKLLTSDEIVETILHETGHFFGLRHTTSTMNDFLVSNDLSIYEDGLEDTPYCIELLRKKLLKSSLENIFYKKPFIKGNIYRRVFFDVTATQILNECPDASNYMFPATVEKPFEGFSKQQLEIIRKNLMLIPH